MTKCLTLNRKPGRDFMRIAQYACPLHSSRRLLQIEQENENNFKHIYETKLTPRRNNIFLSSIFSYSSISNVCVCPVRVLYPRVAASLAPFQCGYVTHWPIRHRPIKTTLVYLQSKNLHAVQGYCRPTVSLCIVKVCTLYKANET